MKGLNKVMLIGNLGKDPEIQKLGGVGKIKTRSYEDKVSVKKYVTEIVTDNFIMLGSSANKSVTSNKANIKETLNP